MKKILLALFLLNLITFSYSQNPELWGVTAQEGEYGGGSIFKADGNGNNYEIEFSLHLNDGSVPLYSKLVEAPNGMLYGMTSESYTGSGAIYSYNPVSDSYMRIHSFYLTSQGDSPYGSLVLAPNGKLYGMTYKGGASSHGVLFEYDLTNNTYTKRVDFNQNTTGRNPYGRLTIAANGMLYGLTRNGGLNSSGTLFEFNTTNNTLTKKLDLDTYGVRFSSGSLMAANNGKLYGMCGFGGTFGKGTLFEYNPTINTIIVHVNFDGTNGGNPTNSLMQASNGMIYGMTYKGGTNNIGVLFEFNPINNIYSKKFDFSTTDGYDPFGDLMEASNGKLYGLTSRGGVSYSGVLFEYDFNINTYTIKYDFVNTNDGEREPKGTLFQASNGILYGTTTKGGTGYGPGGSIFKYDLATGQVNTTVDLDGSDDGFAPSGRLLLASDGKVYGTTYFGGKHADGVLFSYNRSATTFTKLVDFKSDSIGDRPNGGLVEASNGKLYGLVSSGGQNFNGGVFEYDIAADSCVLKVSLQDTLTGKFPSGTLIQASNGKFYFTTSSGGLSNRGALLEYDLQSNTLTKHVDFDGPSKGSIAIASLVEGDNGKLYGMTQAGGVNGGTSGNGVLFEFDTQNNSYTKLQDMDTITGIRPVSTLTQADNGKFYGLMQYGGINGFGTIIEYDASNNTITKKFDFAITGTGYSPQGKLLKATNGKLYGKTNNGVTFEYDIINDIYTMKWSGYASGYQHELIEVPLLPVDIKETKHERSYSLIYPNPVINKLNIVSNVELPNKITIIDVTGKEVKVLTSFNRNIDVSGMVSGIYFIRLDFEDRLSIQQFIKQ